MKRAFTALAVFLSACSVDPYCIRCAESELDGGGPDGRASDARADTGVIDLDGSADTGPCFASDAGEICNTLDDDCDGMIDEDFDLQTNPSHCGRCPIECRFPNADVACVAGVCQVTTCLPGFVDVDGTPGCEYACPVFPTVGEECNGFDDDCDAMIDEAVDLPAPPAGLCRTTPGTPCATVSPICDTRSGTTTWFCNYPPMVEFDPLIPNGIALDETRCDGQDGDCDGLRDETFTALGAICDNGARGACRDVGEIACDPADTSATRCDLSALPDPVAGAPFAEICNAVDDDCDGIVDNSDPTDAGRVRDDMVHVVHGGLDFWIDRYEASRPDASATAIGVTDARSCSRAGVLPWSGVSYASAAAACAAAGQRLCSAAEWQAACEGAAAQTYPYGSAYGTMTCNGADRDAIPGGGIDLRVEPTGTLSICSSADGAIDMSGNVKEWTNDPRGTSAGGQAIYVVRGGSFESPRLGLTCQTELSRATVDTLLPGLGFRCCSATGP